MTAALPDLAGRRARLTDGIADSGAAVLLVTSPVNIRYLCGFTGSNGALLVGVDDVTLVTDSRYREQATAQCPGVRVVVDRGVVDAAVRDAVGRDAAPIMIESEHINLAQYLALTTAHPALLFVPRTGVVEGLRAVKDEAEQGRLREACRIISEAVDSLMARITVGQTERGIARLLESTVLELGAERIAFDTIVAGGPHSAIPHHEPTHRPLRVGDLLKIDAGAVVDGYHSDMTRTFVVGAEPDQQQRELHAAVAAAAAAARAVVADGVTVAQADRAARAELEAAGIERLFVHGLGHGVGLQIHEAPMLVAGSADTMATGNVLTLEPGAYRPGFGGVRIEDTLVVTDTGGHSLTTTTRDLVRLG